LWGAGTVNNIARTAALGADVAAVASCFPPHQLVRTLHGNRPIAELNVGDMVAVAVSDRLLHYRPIEAFYHRQANLTRLPYLHLTTDDGSEVHISRTHLIPIVDCGHDQKISIHDMHTYISRLSRFAHRARAGDCLLRWNEHEQRLVTTRIVYVSGN
jgi:hypothetical protein